MHISNIWKNLRVYLPFSSLSAYRVQYANLIDVSNKSDLVFEIKDVVLNWQYIIRFHVKFAT